MVIVEVPVAPGEAMVTAVLLSAKAGTAFTITGTIRSSFKSAGAPLANTST
jgi:hypothetical protein